MKLDSIKRRKVSTRCSYDSQLNKLESTFAILQKCAGLLSPAFSKKSGGTLFLVFRGAWCVARGAWRVVRGSEFLVGTLSP